MKHTYCVIKYCFFFSTPPSRIPKSGTNRECELLQNFKKVEALV